MCFWWSPRSWPDVYKRQHSHSDSTAPIFTPSIPGGQARQTGTVEAVSAQHFKLWRQRPFINGLEVLKEIRKKSNLPILILTAFIETAQLSAPTKEGAQFTGWYADSQLESEPSACLKT